MFVAQPDLYTQTSPAVRACQPDDVIGPEAGTWRQALVEYNRQYRLDGANPFSLLPAGCLYKHKVYQSLVGAYGSPNVYILSAGWGLIRSDYLLPDYNITFSKQGKVPEHAQRERNQDKFWHGVNHLLDAGLQPEEPIHFFGGKSYLPLYYQLANPLVGRKVIHYMGKMRDADRRIGYEYEVHTGRENMNWQYGAADLFIQTHPREAA